MSFPSSSVLVRPCPLSPNSRILDSSESAASAAILLENPPSNEGVVTWFDGTPNKIGNDVKFFIHISLYTITSYPTIIFEGPLTWWIVATLGLIFSPKVRGVPALLCDCTCVLLDSKCASVGI